MKSITMKEMFPSITDADISASEIKYKISKAIYLKRKEMQMSQKRFAEFLNVTQGMVSKWESFNYNFTIEAITEIFSKLNLELNLSIHSNINEYKKANSNTCSNTNNWGEVIKFLPHNPNLDKAV